MIKIFEKYLPNHIIQQLLFVIVIMILFLLIILPNFFNEKIKTKEVTITYADNISEAHKIIIDKFNKQFKGKIKVETINLPFTKFSTNERKELLARSLRSKSDKIDIFTVDIIWVARFAKWCQPFNKKDLDGIENNLLKYSMASCYYQNRPVALPLYIDIALMYYRKDILSKLPNYSAIKKELDASITWENFIKLSNQFKKSGKPFYIFQADNYEGLLCSLTELIRNKSPKLFGKKINFQNKVTENALQLLVDLVHKYKISPKEVVNFKENNSWEYFIQKNGLFLRGWPGFIRDKKKMLKEHHIENLIVKVPLPHLKGTKPVSVFGGWNFMISKFSKHKKEALSFIKFFLKEDSQKILYYKGGFLPVIKSLYMDKNFLEKNPDILFYKSLLKRGVNRPLMKNYTKISDIFSYYSNKAIKGDMSVKEALKYATKNIYSESFIIK